MKKWCLAVTTVLCFCLLTACAQGQQAEGPVSSPAPVVIQASDSTPLAQQTPLPLQTSSNSPCPPQAQSAAASLASMLDYVDEETTVGTAGCSLKAAQVAATLLDWARTAGLTPEQARQQTADWLMNKGNDAQVAFCEKLALVDSAYQMLMGPDAQSLLSDAGCDDVGYPWGDGEAALMESIMGAVGLR